MENASFKSNTLASLGGFRIEKNRKDDNENIDRPNKHRTEPDATRKITYNVMLFGNSIRGREKDSKTTMNVDTAVLLNT